MKKTCYTCNTKAVKNGIYKGHIHQFVIDNLPKNNKIYHNNSDQIIELNGLKPNKKIFYFATNKSKNITKIETQLKAYDKLQNSGICKVNKEGKAKLYLDCPQIYINANNKVYSRHIHFVYYDDKEKKWDLDLYTHKIFCLVNNRFLNDNKDKIKLIDARVSNNEKNLKNFDLIKIDKLNKSSLIKNLNIKDELKPIVICCSNHIDGEILNNKINNLGFLNTFHYIL